MLKGRERERRRSRGRGRLVAFVSMPTLSIPRYHGNIHLNEDYKSQRLTLNAWCMFLNPVDTLEFSDLNELHGHIMVSIYTYIANDLMIIGYTIIRNLFHITLHEFTNRISFGCRKWRVYEHMLGGSRSQPVCGVWEGIR